MLLIRICLVGLTILFLATACSKTQKGPSQELARIQDAFAKEIGAALEALKISEDEQMTERARSLVNQFDSRTVFSAPVQAVRFHEGVSYLKLDIAKINTAQSSSVSLDEQKRNDADLALLKNYLAENDIRNLWMSLDTKDNIADNHDIVGETVSFSIAAVVFGQGPDSGASPSRAFSDPYSTGTGTGVLLAAPKMYVYTRTLTVRSIGPGKVKVSVGKDTYEVSGERTFKFPSTTTVKVEPIPDSDAETFYKYCPTMFGQCNFSFRKKLTNVAFTITADKGLLLSVEGAFNPQAEPNKYYALSGASVTVRAYPESHRNHQDYAFSNWRVSGLKEEKPRSKSDLEYPELKFAANKGIQVHAVAKSNLATLTIEHNGTGGDYSVDYTGHEAKKGVYKVQLGTKFTINAYARAGWKLVRNGIYSTHTSPSFSHTMKKDETVVVKFEYILKELTVNKDAYADVQVFAGQSSVTPEFGKYGVYPGQELRITATCRPYLWFNQYARITTPVVKWHPRLRPFPCRMPLPPWV